MRPSRGQRLFPRADLPMEPCHVAPPDLTLTSCSLIIRPSHPTHKCVRSTFLQEALLDCVRRVVFQEHTPMGQPATVRLLVNRTQEQGVVDK